MASGDYGSTNFYAGADYGLDSEYGKEFSSGMFPETRYPVSQFGFTTDPRTSNQLKAVSDKLNTGAKTVEVTGVSAAEWESVPEPHLKEIERLKKLAGTDLTFHGPLVEPTGVTREGWNESKRLQAERQMAQAIERAHKMDSKGNLVVTFHSSNGLPDPEVRVLEEYKDPKTGEKKTRERIAEYWVINNEGQFQSLTPKPDYFRSKDGKYEDIEGQKKSIQAAINRQSKDAWQRQLQGASFHAHQGENVLREVFSGRDLDPEIRKNTSEKEWLKLYKGYLQGETVPKLLDKVDDDYKAAAKSRLRNLEQGQIYLKDAYQDLQRMFNEAYEAAKQHNNKTDIEKLNVFRERIKGKVGYLDEPDKLKELSAEILEGVHVLNSINVPTSFKPLRDFAIDKSSETFANVALKGYKKFGETAPIISIENPPVGMGLTRAEDLRELVKNSREQLQNKLMKKEGLSETEAERQAKKLIGVTWDVGHINMLRKYGYEDKEIVKETETIAPFVKHVHLSDNFGMEHTELPMGMGNVPSKKMLDAIDKFNEKAKKIVETGGSWFRDFKVTPVQQTLAAFGSPIYSMKMAPYWNQGAYATGGYFSGYGQTLPEQHFSIYGAGFSNLPPELGGQMGGRSRLGGAPIE